MSPGREVVKKEERRALSGWKCGFSSNRSLLFLSLLIAAFAFFSAAPSPGITSLYAGKSIPASSHGFGLLHWNDPVRHSHSQVLPERERRWMTAVHFPGFRAYSNPGNSVSMGYRSGLYFVAGTRVCVLSPCSALFVLYSDRDREGDAWPDCFKPLYIQEHDCSHREGKPVIPDADVRCRGDVLACRGTNCIRGCAGLFSISLERVIGVIPRLNLR